GVAPNRFVGTTSRSRLVLVVPVRGHRENDLVHRRVRASGPASAVVEHQHMSFAGESLGNPLRVVLKEEFLVLGASGAIGARVAPAIEKVAASSVAAALVPGGLGDAVVDDPNLVEFGAAEHDLVEIGAV